MIRRERIDEIQSMRGIAFFAVVLQHALGMFTRLPGLNIADLAVMSFLFNMAKFAVPMFVFITGLVIFYNYYENLNYPTYLWKRCKEILVPYAIFTPFYYLYWDWQANQHSVDDLWLVFATGSGYYHLWFVAMIFQFYLLFPLFRLLFQKLRPVINTERKVFWSLAVALVLFIATVLYLIDHRGLFNIPGLRGMFGNYIDRNFIMWSFYFVFGGALAFGIVRFRTWLEKAQFWNIPIFVITLFWVTYELARTIIVNPKPAFLLGVSSSLKLSMILFTVSSILLIYSMCVALAKRNNIVTKFLNLLGQYSFGAYLIHAYWLDKFYKIVHNNLKDDLNNTTMMLVALVMTVVASLLFAMIVSKIPFIGPLIVGSSGKKRKKQPQTTSQPQSVGA